MHEDGYCLVCQIPFNAIINCDEFIIFYDCRILFTPMVYVFCVLICACIYLRLDKIVEFMKKCWRGEVKS